MIVNGIEDAEIEFNGGSEVYLNLGMLLPGSINFEKSSLRVFTSERRPYNRFGSWEEDSANKFISFIQAGSIIYPANGRRHVGRSIRSLFEPRAILFGNAILYPIEGMSRRGIE